MEKVKQYVRRGGETIEFNCTVQRASRSRLKRERAAAAAVAPPAAEPANAAPVPTPAVAVAPLKKRPLDVAAPAEAAKP